jgi:hypothetical protein
MYIYTAIIVEPRCHPALEFVLKNFYDNLSDEWKFIIFHGENNKEAALNICCKYFIPKRVKLVNLKVDNLTHQQYNKLFYTDEFYSYIETETFLVFQTDAIICTTHKDLINKFLKYDYVGAPWLHIQNVGNGGLSLRKKSKMLEILKIKTDNNKLIFNNKYINEDITFSLTHDTDNISIFKPSVEESKEFAIESIYNEKSFGLHKTYVYMNVTELSTWCPDILELKRLNNIKITTSTNS